MNHVAIVDLGLGNLGSIKNMLRKIGVNSIITNNIEDIKSSDKIILPGVGSFDTGMQSLTNLGLQNTLDTLVMEDKKPVLGICLGVQLMTQNSEEGTLDGLGWFQAETVKFRPMEQEKILLPNIGWQDVKQSKPTKLFEGMYDDARFYFVHTYYLKPKTEDETILESYYNHPYVVGLEKNNIVGVQFHPEKSHKYGLKLLDNFINNY